MFIKKITGIKNVGRFKSARVSGGNYEPFTLFYAGNGRGKTTLCAILRSLQLGDPKHVLRRKSYKAPADPEITLLHGGGNARFTQGKWDAAQPDIHILISSSSQKMSMAVIR
jgi:wobble nucleotide-excising tRNase